MRSMHLHIQSELHRSILITAIESVKEMENDVVFDLAERLSKSRPFDDEQLDELTVVRRHVRSSESLMNEIGTVAIGSHVFLSEERREVLDRSLEAYRDHLGDAVTEVFHTKEVRGQEFVSKEYVKVIQDSVNAAVDRLVACIDLFYTVRFQR